MNTIPRLFRACTSGLALAICMIAGANAAPACIDPGGIGGTGSPAQSGGIGGTGAPARSGGVGGTGAPVIEHGIGGTGAPIAGQAESGIGGTGAPLTSTPGGIGGTGARVADNGLGGTGIVGTITGFASICVNGVEVHYDDNVPVSMNESPALLRELAVGQVVAVEAGLSERGLEATRISILNAYEGPLTALPTETEPMRVMGQPVRVAHNAQLSGTLQLGQMVRVSGLRNASGEVVATRVERAPDLIEASAIGTLDRGGALQGLTLEATQAVPGGEVLVRGQWSGATLNVARISPDPSVPFAGRVRQAIVEGLVHDRVGSQVMMSGFSVVFESGTEFADGRQNELDKNQRIRVHGVFTGTREVTASRIEFVRPDLGSNGADHGKTSGSGGDDSENKNEGRKADFRNKIDDDGGERQKIESRDDSSRLKIERELSADGEITRERIESRTEGRDGELERRERIDIRESNGVIETRERIEIFEGGERVQRIERIERVETPDKIERPEPIERLDKVERVEKVERAEKIERPEKVERVRRDD